jgi:regulator of cell morphogenesis and NO signaling
MNISSDHRLAEIVDLVPGAPRVLEWFDLDYCCGGQRPLGDACDLAGIDVATVIEALDGLGDGHAYLHAELPRIEALADKVVGVHGARHPELAEVGRLCASLREDLEPHMAKEERVLFPMVRELASAVSPPSFHCGSVANPISMMMREHEQTGSILEALRSQTDGYHAPDDACASYRALYEALDALEADTHLHIHKENNVLFPAVLELEKHWEPAR